MDNIKEENSKCSRLTVTTTIMRKSHKRMFCMQYLIQCKEWLI